MGSDAQPLSVLLRKERARVWKALCRNHWKRSAGPASFVNFEDVELCRAGAPSARAERSLSRWSAYPDTLEAIEQWGTRPEDADADHGDGDRGAAGLARC